MTFSFKPALAAGLALSALAAPAVTAPVAAQVNGIATADIGVAVAGSQALNQAFQQINTQYQSQISTIQQRQQQRQELIQTFDTDNDGQLDQNEQAVTQDASNTTVQQIQAIDREVQQLQAPVNLARLYVTSQVAQQYAAAVQQVIDSRSIQLMIAPDALIYAPENADVTASVIEALNGLVPAANITPPADWQPSDQVVNLFQQVQQVRLVAAVQQQRQQQQSAAQGSEVPSR